MPGIAQVASGATSTAGPGEQAVRRANRIRIPCLAHAVSLSVRSLSARTGVQVRREDLGPGDLAVRRRAVAADAGESEEGVEGGLEWADIALDLGKEETALEYSEEGDGQIVGVGAVRQVPGGVKT